MRKPQGGTPYNGIYTEALREKNDKKTSCFNDLFRSLLKKVYERGAFSNKRYTKGVPFLKKKWNIKEYGVGPWGGASPYKTFLSTPLGRKPTS